MRTILITLLALIAAAPLAAQPQPADPPAAPPARKVNVQIIGFDVDADTETQLRAMAAAAGGRYLPATDGDQLLGALGQAAGVTLPGGAGSEREPNNSHGRATRIRPNGAVKGTVDKKGDVDWYRIDVDAPGQLTLRVQGAGLVLEARLYNPAVHPVHGTVRPKAAGGETQAVVGIPHAGRWKLWVHHLGGPTAAPAPYRLSLTFAEADAHELNNSHGTATRVPPSGELFGSCLPAGDVDWYTFEVPRRGAVDLALTDVPKALTLQLRVFNANVHPLTGYLRPLKAGGVVRETVDLPSAGRYYVRVADHTGRGDPARYRLTMRYARGDDGEPNDRIGQARPIPHTTRLQASILPRGDVDVYGFSVEAAGALHVDLTNVAPELELRYRVFNAEHHPITGHQNPLRAGAENHGVVDLPGPGRYYLIVDEHGSDARSTQPYSLSLRYARADAHEPNNAPYLARARSPLAGPVQATILPKGDTDWFVFTIDQPGKYALAITGVPMALDVHARFFNADWHPHGGWIRPLRAGAETRGMVELKPGIYYLQLLDGGHDARSATPFSVRLTPVQ